MARKVAHPRKYTVAASVSKESYEKLFKFAEQVDIPVSRIIWRWIQEHIDNIVLMDEGK